MPLAAQEEDPKLTKLRAALDKRVGEAQLPELILAVDAEVRFSWIMLGREPRSERELLMVYAGIRVPPARMLDARRPTCGSARLAGRDRPHGARAWPDSSKASSRRGSRRGRRRDAVVRPDIRTGRSGSVRRCGSDS